MVRENGTFLPFLRVFHAHFIKQMTHRLISWISGIGCTRLTLETVKNPLAALVGLNCSKVKLVHPIRTDPLNASASFVYLRVKIHGGSIDLYFNAFGITIKISYCEDICFYQAEMKTKQSSK